MNVSLGCACGMKDISPQPVTIRGTFGVIMTRRNIMNWPSSSPSTSYEGGPTPHRSLLITLVFLIFIFFMLNKIGLSNEFSFGAIKWPVTRLTTLEAFEGSKSTCQHTFFFIQYFIKILSRNLGSAGVSFKLCLGVPKLGTYDILGISLFLCVDWLLSTIHACL